MNADRKPTGLSRRQLLEGASAAAAALAAGSAMPQAFAAEPAKASPRVRSEPFGKLPDGTQVDVYTLSSAAGLEARIMPLGATLLTMKTPDRSGRIDAITLYLDTLDDYLRGHPLFGSVVGRFANRIGNARFTIDGTEHQLAKNAGAHHIHGGGKASFHNVLWKAQPLQEADAAGVRLTHVSPDGAAGYPGTVEAIVEYWLTADNRLVIEYTARTEESTHVNMTNHAYWNLAGAGSGDVLGHILHLNASRYLAADEALIPTGEMPSVKNTPLDFTTPTAVGARIQQVRGENYDHCYVLDKPPGGGLSLAARVREPKTGRIMEVHTTQPGVQLYTAKGVSDRLKGGGKAYGPYHGLCLEAQHFPDTPNHPRFPSTLLRPGQVYRQRTVHMFSAE